MSPRLSTGGKAHFANKGGEVPPDRELSAWPSFLSSYRAELVASGKTRKLMGRSADLCGTAAVKPSKVVKDAGGKKPANLVAVTSQETERHAIEVTPRAQPPPSLMILW